MIRTSPILPFLTNLCMQEGGTQQGTTVEQTRGYLQDAVSHAAVVFRFMVDHMATTYLAYWAEPRGFTQLRACIHLAAEADTFPIPTLLHNLRALDNYIQSTRFQYLRSQVLLPWI
jgi:hypothetical protein